MRIDFEFACRDDCLDQLVPSDLRQLVCERDDAEKRIRDLENYLTEATEKTRQILAAFDQFLRDEGYGDEEIGRVICSWLDKTKEPPR